MATDCTQPPGYYWHQDEAKPKRWYLEPTKAKLEETSKTGAMIMRVWIELKDGGADLGESMCIIHRSVTNSLAKAPPPSLGPLPPPKTTPEAELLRQQRDKEARDFISNTWDDFGFITRSVIGEALLPATPWK